METKEIYQILSSIAITIVLRDKCHQLLFGQTIRIFLKGRTDDAHFAFQVFHQNLNQFCSAIAWDDVILSDAKTLAGDEGVNFHTRGIFREQCLEIGLHLVDDSWRGEVRIHQITEVEHLGESPEATKASVIFSQQVFLVSKQCLCDIQILFVIDFIPFFVRDG